VLSGRSLCDELITRPETSYPLWCVVVCDQEKPQEWGGHDPLWVAAPQQKENCLNVTPYSTILIVRGLVMLSDGKYL